MNYMKKTEPKTPDNQQVPPGPPVLTHTTLGTFKDEKGRWHIAKIRFNPVTKEIGEFEVLVNEEGTKDSANYRFKIQVVKEGIL